MHVIYRYKEMNFAIKANQACKVIKRNSLEQNNMKNKDCIRVQKENGSKPAAYDD